MLPTDYNERKALPIYTFLMEYFPLALLEVVRVAVAGDKQHLNNPGSSPIRWAREKSTDQMNTAMRHQFDYGMGAKYDVDGRSHLGKAIWRLMAQLQLDEERARGLHCGCTINDVPVRRDVCEKHKPPTLAEFQAYVPVAVRKAMAAHPEVVEQLGLYEPDGDTHMPPMPEPPKYEFHDDGKAGFEPRRPRICNECGADLDEGGHAGSCLSIAAQNRQYW